MSEHQEALTALRHQIFEQFGEQADDTELEKIEGFTDLGTEIAAFLQGKADEGTWVDTGSDGTSYDCHVTINGREYDVNVSAGSTQQEMDDWEASLKAEASQWDLLCPRVIAALKAGPDAALADEFEAYVTPRDSVSDPKGENAEGEGND